MQPVRVERVAAARAVEVVLEALGRGELLELRVPRAGVLDAHAVLRGQALGAGRVGGRPACGSSSKLCQWTSHGVAVLEALERRLEAPLAEVAPRAHDVGPDIDEHGIQGTRSRSASSAEWSLRPPSRQSWW